jgi:hypothetical protein
MIVASSGRASRGIKDESPWLRVGGGGREAGAWKNCVAYDMLGTASGKECNR